MNEKSLRPHKFDNNLDKREWPIFLPKRNSLSTGTGVPRLWAKWHLVQGIRKGEVSLYHWPPVWLVWNQLYDNWQFLFLFAKQTNPNQSNRRPPLSIPFIDARPPMFIWTVEFFKCSFLIPFTLLRLFPSLRSWGLNKYSNLYCFSQ
jgi:hypothetical protein